MFTTSTEARTAVIALNNRIHVLNANSPKMDAGTEAHMAYNALRRELRSEGEAAGFIRIFDNSFKMNAAQIALPN
jgi:hypothetical protein